MPVYQFMDHRAEMTAYSISSIIYTTKKGIVSTAASSRRKAMAAKVLNSRDILLEQRNFPS
jgi:hypothetical protein